MRVFALLMLVTCSSAFAQKKDLETVEGPCISAWKTNKDVDKNRFTVLSDEDWRVDVEECVDQEVMSNSLSTIAILIK